MNSEDFQAFLKSVLPAMGYRWRRFDRRNIRRRIRLRMESLRIYELDRYAGLVNSDANEREIFDALLRLTITRFFRNRELWQELEILLKKAAKGPGPGKPLNIWSAGCAGGEEPLSMAMLLLEMTGSGGLKSPWTVLGTDTDTDSLQRARGAVYGWGSVREVPDHLLERWFIEDGGSWTLNREIRDKVRIEEHDLVAMEPPGRFHVVFLRNSVLTYNTEEVQRKILDRIRRCLLDPGYLVIGRTETMPEGAGFEQVGRCIYRKT